MTLEECRRDMLAHHERLIEESARQLAEMLYPRVPLEAALSVTEPICRKAIFDSLDEKTKLFLLPAGPTC